MQRAELTANAKLTLSLRITGVREDGFHLIDAEMVTLSIADNLVVEPNEKTQISVAGKYADGVPTDESNLITKALRLCEVAAKVTLTKNVPNGGGLGGGSSDAAAILRWCGFTDLVAASKLGSDIPFCMIGGRARVQGIGEIITPLESRKLDLTLIIPPIHVSTPVVYKMWDELGGPLSDNSNDLEPAALAAFPALRDWRDEIEGLSGLRPNLAGSGATWFLYGAHQDLKSKLPEAQVVVTTTIV